MSVRHATQCKSQSNNKNYIPGGEQWWQPAAWFSAVNSTTLRQPQTSLLLEYAKRSKNRSAHENWCKHSRFVVTLQKKKRYLWRNQAVWIAYPAFQILNHLINVHVTWYKLYAPAGHTKVTIYNFLLSHYSEGDDVYGASDSSAEITYSNKHSHVQISLQLIFCSIHTATWQQWTKWL